MGFLINSWLILQLIEFSLYILKCKIKNIFKIIYRIGIKMLKFQTISIQIGNYLAQTTLDMQFYHSFYASLLFIRAFQTFIIFNDQKILPFISTQALQINSISIIFLSFQIIALLFIIISLLINRQSNRRKRYQEKQYYHNIHLFIRKIIKWIIVVARFVCVVPLMMVFAISLRNNSNSQRSASVGLAVLNLVIFLLILYPIGGLSFWNKIALKKQMLSYAQVINFQTLIYAYLPIAVLLKTLLPKSNDYLNIIFTALCIILVYYRPIVTLNFKKVSIYGTSSVTGILFISSLYNIMQLPIDSAGKVMFYLFINAICIKMFSQYAFSRSNKILLKNKLCLQKNNKTYQSKDQCLFLSVMNFKENQSKLSLFLINSLIDQQNSTNKSETKLLNQFVNKIYPFKKQNRNSQNQYQTINKLKQIKQKIFQILSSNAQDEPDQQQLKSLFVQFTLIYFMSKYDPKSLMKENIGKKQLQNSIFINQKIYIFIAQLIMIKKDSVHKAYYLIKLHEKLLKQIKYLNFFQNIEINILKLLLQQQINLLSRLNKEYNSNAEQYFKFSQNVELLKERIQKSSQAYLQFWQQMKQKQQNEQKIQNLIQKNFYYMSKVQSEYKKITCEFDGKCNLVIFELINQYSKSILNNQIQHFLSPFKNLIKSVNHELQLLMKQGYKNTSQQLYRLLQNIGVCLVQLQSQKYQINWGNQFFWKQCYGNKKIADNSKDKHFILFDMIFEEIRERHKFYISQFQSNYNFNFKHGTTLLYFPESKTYQNVRLQFQILPTLQQGLKLSVFIVKQQKSHFGLILNQNLNMVAETKQFKKQIKEMIFSHNQNTCYEDQISQFLQYVKQKTQFLEMIQKIKKNHTNYNQNKEIFQADCQQNEDQNKNKQNDEILQITQKDDVKDQHTQLQISMVVGLQNSDYKMTFNKKIEVQNTNNLNGHQQNSQNKQKYLLQFNIINLLNNQKQSERQQLNQLDIIKNSTQSSNFNVTLQKQALSNRFTSGTNFNLLASTITTQQNKQNKQIKNNNNMIQVQQELFKQKSQNERNLNKKILSINSDKIPKPIITWRVITIALIILINANLLVNIIISINKKTAYNNHKNMIKSFNQIMAGTTEMLIALRKYNYYANVYGPMDERIPFLVTELLQKQVLMAKEIRQISTILTDQWMAWKFTTQGQIIFYTQKAYVMLVNYVLSPMAFLARTDPKYMGFPFLLSRFPFWKGYNPTEANYFQAINNGLYNCLGAMSFYRLQLNQKIQKQILPIQKQLFIYPTIIGISLIMIFIVFSSIIQIKSNNIKGKLFHLLSLIQDQIIEQKLKTCKQYSHQTDNNRQVQNLKLAKQNTFQYLSKTLQFPSNQDKQGMLINSLTKRKSNFFPQNIQPNETNREINTHFKENNQENSNEETNKQDLQGNNTDSKNPPIKIRKGTQFTKQISQINVFRNLNFSKVSKCKKIMFYFLICVPFFIYFIVVFIGGINLNQNIMTYLKTSSQLYYRKTKLSFTYLYVRQTALYEAYIIGNMDWVGMQRGGNQQCYDQQKDLAKLLQKINDDTHLKQYLKRIQNQNLCRQINTFKPSIKYNITFSAQQCQYVANQVLTQGLRSTLVSFLQTGLSFTQMYPNPGYMGFEQRKQLIQGAQLNQMRVLLAYLYQIFDISIINFESDLSQLIQRYNSMVVVYSIVSAFMILYLCYAINYRWKLLIKEKKQVKSIIKIISFKSLKQNGNLRKYLEEIDCSFYQ